MSSKIKIANMEIGKTISLSVWGEARQFKCIEIKTEEKSQDDDEDLKNE